MKAKTPKRLEDIEITPEAARLFELAVDRATAPGANRRTAAGKVGSRRAAKARKRKSGAAS